MTPYANPMTARATYGIGGVVKLALRSQLVRPVLLEVRERGGDPGALIARFGLPADAADVPEIVVDLEVYYRFMDAAAEAAGDPHLGLHVGQRPNRGTFGLLEFILRTAPTVREALSGFARYAVMQNDIMVIALGERDGDMFIEQKVPGAPQALGRHGNEHFVAKMLHEARRALDLEVSPRRVWLAHAAPADTRELARVLGTERIAFQAGANGLGFDPAILDLPFKTADPALFDVLKRHAQQVTPARAENALVGELRQILRPQLPYGPDLALVARAMGTSTRTLQRRLADEKMTFAEVVDGLRRELAEAYLREPDRALGEIAFLLGYTELRAFLRAFKRWTGTTPSSYRKRLASG
jgi:AraC-like DNA-binding protein